MSDEPAAARPIPPAGPADPPRNRRFWQRWLVDPVARQLTQGVTPQKVALSLAVGSALALFPILGTTTALCLVAGVALGLNQPIIQGVNALCTFVYFPLLYPFGVSGTPSPAAPARASTYPS